MSENNLYALYTQAQQALKAKDYDRAADLLRQILMIDENYKDVSRLLAEIVRGKRRRWYNDFRLWGIAIGMIVIGLLAWIVPNLSLSASPAPTTATVSVTATIIPTMTVEPTITPSPAPTAIPLEWKRISIGQEFERDTVAALAIDPKDQDVLYAGMKNAGIYKSIDGGLSWRPAHYGLSNTQVESLSIDPQNQRILYAGTMGGIYKTEDGGENWSRFFEGISLLMDPQDSAHLYVRDSEGIYESTDQGNNWKTVYSTSEDCPGTIFSWAIHPIDGESLFVIGGEKCEWGVYLSNDGGHAWTLVNKIGIPRGANILDWGVDKLAVGLDERGKLDIHPYETAAYDSTGSVYTYWDSQLRKSSPGDDRTITLGRPDVGKSMTAVTVIVISPFDPDTIYIGGEGLSVSRDGGLTWTKLNNGLGIGTIQLNAGLGDTPILYIQPGECGKVEVYSQGHRMGQDDAGQPLYLSTNGGQSWELSLHAGCYLIQDADTSTIYRVGQDWIWSTDYSHVLEWLWLSRDQGNTWQTNNIMDVYNPFTIVAHPFQNGILYAYSSRTFRHPGYGGEKTFKSVDYGNNWKTADATGKDLKLCYGSTLQFIDAYRPMVIDPSDGNHVFVIENGTLLESHDSCDTTETFATAPSTSMNSIAFDPKNSEIVYAGTDGGAYVSFDVGKTWGQVNDGLLGATVVYSIVVDKDSNVYAATPYGVFKLEGK